MNEVVQLCSYYSLTDAQSYSINNVSLCPFYRNVMKPPSSMHDFFVMGLNCQHLDTTLMNWPWVVCHVDDFSDEGKHALLQLVEQVNHLMPAVTAKEAATVFIDPLTKGFAEELLKDVYGH